MGQSNAAAGRVPRPQRRAHRLRPVRRRYQLPSRDKEGWKDIVPRLRRGKILGAGGIKTGFEIYQPKTLNLPVAVFVPFDSVGPAAVEVVAPAFILALMKALLPFHAMAGAIAFA